MQLQFIKTPTAYFSTLVLVCPYADTFVDDDVLLHEQDINKQQFNLDALKMVPLSLLVSQAASVTVTQCVVEH